jgi:Asp-tRNA(Asn)/Glu-tRNA(Gln) amidotransferase A subunit family amidase
MPSLPTPAPLHNESTLRIFDVSNTGFFNVMELPVTAIPVGLTSDQGVPIGLQVISGRGQDHLCIAVAKALQEGGLAGWRPPVKL